MTDAPPIVMVFAATDPTGGAGLQADIMTLASMGCHPVSVVTAITIQDTMGVDEVQPVDGEWVADHLRAAVDDGPDEGTLIARCRAAIAADETLRAAYGMATDNAVRKAYRGKKRS